MKKILFFMIVFVTAIGVVTFIWDRSVSKTPLILEPQSDIVINVDQSTLYDLNDIPFRFILANITITQQKSPLYFELSRIKTDEQVLLSEVDIYKSELVAQGYDLSKQNVQTLLQSEFNSLKTTLFIPIKSYNRSKLSLIVSGIKNNKIEFDLTQATGTKLQLGKKVDVTDEIVSIEEKPLDTTIEQSDFDLDISALALTQIEKDLVLYRVSETEFKRINFPIHSKLFVTQINSRSEKPIKIISARLTHNQESQVVFPLKPAYQIGNEVNILNNVIPENGGYLLFQIDNFSFDPLSMDYYLEVRIDSKDEWIKIPFNVSD